MSETVYVVHDYLRRIDKEMTCDKKKKKQFLQRLQNDMEDFADSATTTLTENDLGQHRTIAEASAVESPIRQETIGFPAHFFARAHNFKPPGRACQPEADSPMRT